MAVGEAGVGLETSASATEPKNRVSLLFENARRSDTPWTRPVPDDQRLFGVRSSRWWSALSSGPAVGDQTPGLAVSSTPRDSAGADSNMSFTMKRATYRGGKGL